jgi:outer membrane protein insertion porin family
MMRTPLLHAIGCLLLLHLLGLQAHAAIPLKEIVIEGNRFVSEDKVRRILRLQNGTSYEEKDLTAAVRRLFATKEFADVRIFREDVRGELRLTVVVREYPKIDEVRFEGNKHINKEDLVKEIAIKGGAFVRPSLLRKDFRTIEDLYKDKGYYRVAVDDTIQQMTDKRSKSKSTVLLYKITEGEKVSIKHIDFFGNLALDSDEIRKVMDSKEDRWFRGADFKPKVLKEDYEKILTGYRENGFLDAEIKNEELNFSEDGSDLDIFITVSEGKRYKVGDITWEGNEIFKDEQIEWLITMKEGDVFNDTEFQNIQFAVNSLYWDRGYIYNSVSPEKKVHGDVISVKFDIEEGKPAHIHEINITGNTKTSEEVIRRELFINPGDVFLRPRLIRSLREVFNLGFFNGPPQVGTSTANSDGDIDISLKVEERQTGQFRMGAGFSALNSMSGFLGLAETNFLGKGLQVGIDWEFSRYRQNVDLRFTEPWLFGTPTELSLSVFNRMQDQVRQQFWDDRRRGFSVRVVALSLRVGRAE